MSVLLPWYQTPERIDWSAWKMMAFSASHYKQTTGSNTSDV
jgi:hypothetical protein